MTAASPDAASPLPGRPQPSGPITSRPLHEVVELLSSMRFAISLLTLICIASVIGTVIKQHEAPVNYVNQFGPFWAPVFERLGLYSVYSASWFLLILAFLVTSTSLCIARNTPKILKDLRSFKENLREQGLQAFHHKAHGQVQLESTEAMEQVAALIGSRGWKAKAQAREQGVMVAARKGRANKLGYIAAHSAIVLICLGGLLDSDVIVRALMQWRGVSAFSGGGFIKDVPAGHRLPASNPTFRGNLMVSEGQRAGVAVLNQNDGVVLQDLPFDIELKKFIVDFYPTGMPKLFASNIIIHDRETGESIPATVKVNEPAFHRGVAIYQSSFEDGGSQLKLTGLPLAGGEPVEVEGQVGSGMTLTSSQGPKTTLEFTGLRVFNVENFADAGQSGDKADVRAVDLVRSVEAQLGSGEHTQTRKDLRNIGPSVSYKLRDEAGQAREYNNYMQPVELDGQSVFLAGVRENPSDAYRFLRIPADAKGTMDSWLGLRRALLDARLRDQAVDQYVKAATPTDKPELGPPLAASAKRAMALFAGADAGQNPAAGGFPAVSDFIEKNVPANERERAAEVLIRILNGSLFELLNLSLERAGQPRLVQGEPARAYMTQAVMSLSDSFFYPAPMLFMLKDFSQVQASVFQLTRSPGKKLVYAGCAFLILGVFAMLYVRERRLWIWLQDDGQGGTRYTAAMSTTRQTMDADREFEQLSTALASLPRAATGAKENP